MGAQGNRGLKRDIAEFFFKISTVVLLDSPPCIAPVHYNPNYGDPRKGRSVGSRMSLHLQLGIKAGGILPTLLIRKFGEQIPHPCHNISMGDCMTLFDGDRRMSQ